MRMRNSMAQLTAQFSTDRTVREYTERYYVPAAAAYRDRVAQNSDSGSGIAAWRHALERQWPTLRFGAVNSDSVDQQHVFDAAVYVGELSPDDVAVEVYAEAQGDETAQHVPMNSTGASKGDADGWLRYTASVASERPVDDYTLRLYPQFEGVSVPLEAPHILWQR